MRSLIFLSFAVLSFAGQHVVWDLEKGEGVMDRWRLCFIPIQRTLFHSAVVRGLMIHYTPVLCY